MVAVAADEGSIGESPERRTLVLSFLVCQELRVVDTSIVALLVKLTKSESAFLRVCKGIIDQKEIVNAPYALVCERAETGLQHRKERREEISICNLILVLEAMEILSHARIGRIVIHIAHADDLDARIFLLHLHRMVVHDLTSTVAELIAALLAAGT